jgi:3-oxoacyl-[acyl-carrier-protein] synthase II
MLHPGSSLQSIEPPTAPYFKDPYYCASSLLGGIGHDPSRLAVVCGASKGDLSALPQWADGQGLKWTPDFFAHHLAALLHISGPVLSPNAACATSTHALALGASLIQHGQADLVIAGGVEWPQPPLILAAYRNMHALSKAGIMRPFDARRDGFLPASGFGFLLLESEASALDRDAKIHGFLTGWSLKCDATHMTSMSPGGDTIARAIEEALRRAGNPKIDYINAHGTATKLNDAIESRAIKAVFGTKVPVSSTKSLTGHLLGAAGVVESAICLLAMKENFAPPTLHLEERDAECDLDYLPQIGRRMDIGAVLSLNYGFGGHIGALVFEKNELRAADGRG